MVPQTQGPPHPLPVVVEQGPPPPLEPQPEPQGPPVVVEQGPPPPLEPQPDPQGPPQRVRTRTPQRLLRGLLLQGQRLQGQPRHPATVSETPQALQGQRLQRRPPLPGHQESGEEVASRTCCPWTSEEQRRPWPGTTQEGKRQRVSRGSCWRSTSLRRSGFVVAFVSQWPISGVVFSGSDVFGVYGPPPCVAFSVWGVSR